MGVSAKVLPIFITHKEEQINTKWIVPMHNSHCYLWPLAIFLVGGESHVDKIPAVSSQKLLGLQFSKHQDHQRFSDWRNCPTHIIGDS